MTFSDLTFYTGMFLAVTAVLLWLVIAIRGHD